MDKGYTLESFIHDLDRLTRIENDLATVVEMAALLLQQLVANPQCIEPRFHQRGAPTDGICSTERPFST
jgi:hypothetical protein